MYTSCIDSAKLQASSSALDGALEEGYKLNRSVDDLASKLDSCDNDFDNCFASIIGELEEFEEDIVAVPNCVSNLRDLLGGALYAYGVAESGTIDVSLISNEFKKIYGDELNAKVSTLKMDDGTATSTDFFIQGMDSTVRDYISENVLRNSLDDLPVELREKYDSSMDWYNDLKKKYVSYGYTEREAELLAKKEMVKERLGETNSLVVEYAESKYDQQYSKYGEISNEDYISLKEKYKQQYGLSEEDAGKLARAECEAKDAAIDMQSDQYSKTEMQRKIDNYKSLLEEYNISDTGNKTVSTGVDAGGGSTAEEKTGTGTSTDDGSSSTTTTTTSSNSGGVSYRYDSSAQSTNSNTGTVSNTVNTQTTVVENTEVLDTNVDSTTSSTVVDKTDNVGSNPVTDIIKDSPSNTLPSDTVTNNNTVVETPSTPTDTSTNTNVNTYTPGNNTTPTYNYNNNYTPNTSVSDSSNVEVAPSTSDTPSTSTDNSSVAGSIAGAIGGSTSKGSVVSKIPTSSEPIKSSSSGSGSNVIPIIAGVGAAAAAGIGAKVYLDRKNNNDNTDSYDGGTSSGIEAEDWSDQSNLSIDYDDSDNQENEYLDSTDDYSYVTEEVEKYSAKDSSDLAEQQL